MAANPLALPKIPDVPQEVKDRIPTLRSAFQKMEQANEQWRQQTQTTIEQALMALKLDSTPATTTIIHQTTVRETPDTAPTVVKGPPGKPGHQRFYNADTGKWVKIIVRGTPVGKNRHLEYLDETEDPYVP